MIYDSEGPSYLPLSCLSTPLTTAYHFLGHIASNLVKIEASNGARVLFSINSFWTRHSSNVGTYLNLDEFEILMGRLST
jgi:hypothetical protein